MIASRVVTARGSLRVSHYIFAVALVIRLFTLARLSGSPFLKPTGSDMLFYHDWALRILHGQLTTATAFYGLPLYAYWLAFLYKLFGIGSFIPLFFQAVADAGTALLIYQIASTSVAAPNTRLRFHLPGTLAAAGWILFVPAEAYSAVLMPTSYGIFVFWFVVSQIISAHTFTVSRVFWNAMLLGIGAMAVANVLVAFPLLLLAILLKPSTPNRRLLPILVASIALILATAPCWFHNYFIARDPVFLSAHNGINLWIGNNPDATGYPHFPDMRAGQAALLEDSINMAEAASHRSLKRFEVSAYWKVKARQFIIGQPTAWLKLLARKFANFFNAFEYDDVGVISIFRQSGMLPGFHFGVIAALGIPGILFTLPQSRQARWVAAACLLQLLSILSLFVTERYRLVVVPGLLLFATAGVVIFAEALIALNWQRIALYVVALGGATILISQPRHDPSLWALKFYNIGRQALDAGNLAVAETNLMRALAYVPDNAETTFALGNLRLAQGHKPAARQLYLDTLKLDPQHKGALTNLGVLALDAQERQLADTYFAKAVELAPNDAKTHYLEAKVRFELNDYAAAASEIDRALALRPGERDFLALQQQIRDAVSGGHE